MTVGGKDITESAEYDEPGFPLASQLNDSKPSVLYPDIGKIGRALRGVVTGQSQKGRKR